MTETRCNWLPIGSNEHDLWSSKLLANEKQKLLCEILQLENILEKLIAVILYQYIVNYINVEALAKGYHCFSRITGWQLYLWIEAVCP